MTSQQSRAAALAGKISEAIKEVDTPNRNARAIVTDAGLWSTIAAILVEEFGHVEAEEVADTPAEDDDPKPRTRRKKS